MCSGKAKSAFRIGALENLDSLAEHDLLYETGGEYYNTCDIDEMLDNIESDSL